MSLNEKSYSHISKYYDNSCSAKRYYSCAESSNWRDRISHKQLELVLSELNHKIMNEHPVALDIGCSSGRYTKALNQKGIRTIGIDTAINPLIFASSRVDGDFIRASAANMPFKKKFFDMIICVELFHHFTDRVLEIVLEEIANIIRPGGTLIFDLKNKLNPLISYKYIKDGNDEYPLKCRTDYKIKSYMDTYGFKIVERKSVIFPVVMFAPYILYFCTKD